MRAVEMVGCLPDFAGVARVEIAGASACGPPRGMSSSVDISARSSGTVSRNRGSKPPSCTSDSY